MRFIPIIILLFGHTLLAHAVEPELGFHQQNQQVSVVKDDPFISDDTQQANELNERHDEELAANETRTPVASYFQKAYDDLISVMPNFGSTENNTARTDEKEKVDNVILKFASMPRMRSAIVLIYDENADKPLHSKNASVVAPIASITKLMTAMVILDAKLPLDEEISISTEDINRQKRTRSKTRTGMTLTRGELLKLALMASDNLSAAALARTYPGGTEAALQQMNVKARELGMNSTRFLDPTGLNSGNVSTANDLVKMVRAARGYELIQRFTTSTTHTVELVGHRPMRFHNTNPLVKNASWDIGLSKTGYISEAGRCLVMEANIIEHPVIIVLLDSWGRNSRIGDANRVKRWMENASLRGARESKEM